RRRNNCRSWFWCLRRLRQLVGSPNLRIGRLFHQICGFGTQQSFLLLLAQFDTRIITSVEEWGWGSSRICKRCGEIKNAGPAGGGAAGDRAGARRLHGPRAEPGVGAGTAEEAVRGVSLGGIADK